MVYIKKTDNRIMNNTGQLNEPQLKVFNKVLNKLLSQKFPWWFEGIEISRAGMNDNQKYLYMDGNIYVDADWIGTQWRKYNDYKPVPEFGSDYDDYSFGDLVGINDGWIDQLKESFILVFKSIYGGKSPKYLSFSWLMVKPVETKENNDEMVIQENTNFNINDITFFKTSQGSKYVRMPDGRLRRWKSYHQNTAGEDKGLHEWSDMSVFVDPKYGNEASSIEFLMDRGFKVSISKSKNGKMVLLVSDNGQWRVATWNDAYPKYVQENPNLDNKPLGWEYVKEPKIGYHVVDFSFKNGRLGSYHFGSEVSEIGEFSDEDKKLFFPSYFKNNLKEQILEVLREEARKKYLKSNERTEKFILDRLNKIFSDMNMYHTESYKTRHDIEFCKNGKKMMNLALFFEETDDRRPTSERKFMESFLSIPKEFFDDILNFVPIRKNYLLYLIEEWFEDNFLNDIINEMGRNDISVDGLSFMDRVDICVPPVTEKPEGVTQDDMIEFIMKGTLFKRNDLLRYEDNEPGYIEDLYLKKLRNKEMDRLSNEQRN